MSDSTNLILQYIVVGAILVAVAVWIIWKLIRLKKHGKPDACCGCGLYESCNKKNLKKHQKTCSDENNENMEQRRL